MNNSLRFIPASVAGAFLIDPVIRQDERGYFSRLWCGREFAEAGIQFIPVQANTAFNVRKGTLRGLHFQLPPAAEAKLVRCTRGSLFDVALDLRSDSPTYGRWHAVELRADRSQLWYVPPGCAHGYQTLEDETELQYMSSAMFTPEAARGVRFDDPAFAITWPLTPTAVSEQDRRWPLSSEVNSYFPNEVSSL